MNVIIQNKRRALIGICFFVFCLSLFSSILYIKKVTSMKKYLIIKESLYLEDSVFIRADDYIYAEHLGDQIGVTDENHQVYKIDKQNPAEKN